MEENKIEKEIKIDNWFSNLNLQQKQMVYALYNMFFNIRENDNKIEEQKDTKTTD